MVAVACTVVDGGDPPARASFAVQLNAMAVSLADLLPDASWDPTGDVLLDRFLQYTAGRRLTLYPAQEEAILELLEEIARPPSACKSLLGRVEVGPREEFGNRNILRRLHCARSTFGPPRCQSPQ